jgi:hypothetical protein
MLTILDGEPMERVADPPLQPWAALPESQRGKVIPIRPVR